MIRTQEQTWRIEHEEGLVIVASPVGRGGVVMPESMTVAVDGLDRPLLLDFRWDTPSHGVALVGIRGGSDAEGQPMPLPARITRAVAPRRLVAEVLQKSARRIKQPPVAQANPSQQLGVGEAALTLSFEDAGPISDEVAEVFARGRDKSQQSVRMMQAEAKRVHAEVVAEGGHKDVYAEVARRLHVGRTTAYTYLRDAGVVGKGRKR